MRDIAESFPKASSQPSLFNFLCLQIISLFCYFDYLCVHVQDDIDLVPIPKTNYYEIPF